MQKMSNLRIKIPLYYLILIGLLCFLGPFLLSYNYEEQNLVLGASAPSPDHLMGTDPLGRDLLARTLYGGRITLLISFSATVLAVFIGVIYGMVSGFQDGIVDRLMMRFVDMVYALPFILFVILFMVTFGQNLFLLFLCIGAVEWMTIARITRSQVRVLKYKAFIEVARCLGQKPFLILSKHLLPNLIGIILVYATLMAPSIMLLESFISFLGLGVKAPMSSWGLLIKEGSETLEIFPWLFFFPAFFFSTTLLALNFLGDALRDQTEVLKK